MTFLIWISPYMISILSVPSFMNSYQTLSHWVGEDLLRLLRFLIALLWTSVSITKHTLNLASLRCPERGAATQQLMTKALKTSKIEFPTSLVSRERLIRVNWTILSSKLWMRPWGVVDVPVSLKLCPNRVCKSTKRLQTFQKRRYSTNLVRELLQKLIPETHYPCMHGWWRFVETWSLRW